MRPITLGDMPPRRGISTGLLVVGVAYLMLASPLASAAQPAKTLSAPYVGTSTLGSNPSTTGSGKAGFTNSSYFSFRSGSGGFAGSVSANATTLQSMSSGFNTAQGEITSQESLKINFPFHNASGTKTITTINVSFRYAVVGNLTLSSGSCPWIKNAHHANECISDSYAIISIVPEYFIFESSGKQVPFQSSSCIGCNVLNDIVSNFSKNGSRGLTSTATGKMGTTSISKTGSGAITFIFSKPITKSRIYSVWFYVSAAISAELQAYRGNGGLVGASCSASINFATGGNGFTVTSIAGS
jgi:hypothetical protein